MELQLYSFLLSNDFHIDKSICSIIEQKLTTKRKAFLLKGPAGTGKTQLTHLIAKFINAKYVFYQCTYGCSEDDLLYKYIPSENSKSGIKIALGPIPLALILSRNEKVVLTIDEFDKTRPSADALLLDLLQNFRVSLYIDEKEQIVEGNPDNLIIFLTSNEMREFSEPLLRRLTIVALSHLPANKVYDLLSKKFRPEVATLLTQIYSDTINAGLRKPATIQELCELGEILESSSEFDLEMLLRSIVIKYDDDWDRYVNYISSRKPYQFIKNTNFCDVDVAKYYEPPEDIQILTSSSTSSEDNDKHDDGYVLQELQKKLKVPVSERKIEVEEADEKEVFMIAEDNDHEAYTKIIKTLRPKPTDRPDEFDKFKMYFDNKVVIVANKPLSVYELDKLRRSKMSGEFYAESIIPVVDFDCLINELLNGYGKVEYYSKHLIRCSSNINGNIYVAEAEVINRHNEDVVDIILRMYAKGTIDNNMPFVDPSRVSLLRNLSNSTYYDNNELKQYASKLLKMLNFIENAKNLNISLAFSSTYLYKCQVIFDDVVEINVLIGSSLAEKLKIGEVFGISINDKITDIKVIREILTYIIQHVS